MPDSRKGNRFFWGVALASYALVVAAIFARIYIYHDYPIFYTEDEIPDMAGEIWAAVTGLGL